MKPTSPWKLGGLSWKEFFGRLWAGANDDDVLGRAGQIAYSAFFAIFPLLIFLTAILGSMAGAGSRIRADLVQAITSSMPPAASRLITRVLQETAVASGSGKLSFGLVVTLISASSGVSAIMDTLNGAYEVKEGRSILRFRLIALALTVVIGILIIASTTVILYGNAIVSAAANVIGLGEFATVAWKILQWPVAILFLLLSYALLYYFGPDVEFPKWHWITPGSIAGVFLSLLISFSFRVYLHYFGSFSQTYGSLGAAMILLLWFYVMGLAILLGGEVNSEIESAAARRGEPAAKRKGEKVPTKTPDKAA